MKLRVGLLAATAGATAAADPRASLEQCGNNTGNLLFHHATHKLLLGPLRQFDWRSEPNEIRETCDVLVVPEANAVNPSRDYAERAHLLRSAGLPCVVLGLGAQAPAIGDHIPLLNGTKQFLHELSAHCRSIGVRGEYTSEVLGRLGIHNTQVTGCPSNLTNLEGELGTRLARRSERPLGRLQIGAGDMKRALRSIERRLFDWSLAPSSRYVLQSGSGVLIAKGVEVGKSDMAKLFRHFGVRPWQRSGFITEFRRVAVAFFDAEEWLVSSQDYDAGISTRVHSTICAIQAGVPAVLIHHDSRTDELRRTLGLPAVSLAEAEHHGTPSAMLLASQPDWSAFDALRREQARSILSLLEAEGIDCSPDLVNFAQTGG